MSKQTIDIEQRAVHCIRMLAADGVEQANSGHPGMPMGMADCAYLLYHKMMRHDPAQPDWPGRDRFILSAGHGSMLLYAMLHLSGYDLSIDDLKAFRQLGSRTPGHPELGHTPGVETTTGPLGQGLGNAVGLALASRMLHARLENDGFSPADFRVFGIAGDGDMMEGLSSEVASLAGHWKLGNLNFIYDDNSISIEGSTDLAFTEDVGTRFEAYGWQVLEVNAHDREAVLAAMEKAANENGRPSLIKASSHIGFGSPNKQDTAGVHGSPLGADELKATKENLGWPTEPAFFVPEEVRAHFAERAQSLGSLRADWQEKFEAWRERAPEKAKLWEAMQSKPLAKELLGPLMEAAGPDAAATRALSGKVLQKAATLLPALVGGSADLSPSNKTELMDLPAVQAGSYEGRNLHFGIREHAMGSIMNGMILSGGLIPYGGTFMVFADYMRPPMRLAALMNLGCIYVLTHDSIFVGEDGPTHQPVEHLASLRCIPNLVVLRPADPAETAAAWTVALARRDGPTALVLTRQKLPILKRPDGFKPEDMLDGAYTLVKEQSEHKAVVVATGSEVAPAAAAARKLGIRALSMPSLELFFALPEAKRNALLPPDWKVAVVETSRDHGWHRLAGADGLVIGMEGFGASAPASDLAEHFGFTDSAIEQKLEGWLKNK